MVNKYPLQDYVLHGVFYTLYGLVKYLPSPVGDWLRFVTLKCFVRSMGKVKVKEGVHIVYPNRLTLGHNVSLNAGVTVDASGGVEIGDCCRIAHNVTILSSDHVFADRTKPIFEQGLSFKKTVLEADCWLGCNATILMGSKLKKGTIVAANSVVNKDFDAYSIVGGIPAKLIKQRP